MSRKESLALKVLVKNPELFPVCDELCEKKIAALTGDHIHLDYKFNVEYLGGCENRLKLVLQLLKDAGSEVTEISLNTLSHAESLLVSMVDQVREIQRRLTK